VRSYYEYFASIAIVSLCNIFFSPIQHAMNDFYSWKNVGKSIKTKHFGELMSFVFTFLLCVFWTVPVAFVAALSNVEALAELLPFLKEPVEKYKAFSTVLGLLAPLLLVIFTSLLPTILLSFVKLECLIEIETMLHPSLFSKLATFTILQTFFIVSRNTLSPPGGRFHPREANLL
jgi:hypothetical protein